MHFPKFILLWIFAVCFHQVSSNGAYESEVNNFFDDVEKVINKIMNESNSEDPLQPGSNRSDSRQLRYLIPQAMANYEDDIENLYDPIDKTADDPSRYAPENNGDFSNPGVVDRKNIMDFAVPQEFVFRPLYECDHYDAFRKHCTFRRQLGTTLTLGVHLGKGVVRQRINWYRCLRMKHFDNIIKIPLRKGFLPWNLNLGGSGNELRISPITDVDLKDNFFLAELAGPQTYKRKYADKSVIHFDVESIEIDMGSLYPGEEIVVYARAFMELPRTSVHFLWSLMEKDSLEDHGLPSNMKLNYDKSSVVIKELRTTQDQYLIYRAYSNKNVLLARRSFLFRGFDMTFLKEVSDMYISRLTMESLLQRKGKSETNNVFNHKRQKRDIKYGEHAYGASNKWQYEETENPLYMEKVFENEKIPKYLNQEVPSIEKDLFYASDTRKEVNRFPYSDNLYTVSSTENDMAEIMRRFIREETTSGKKSNIKNIPVASEKLRFEDHESQMMATCQTNSDCNIHANCTQSPFNGQYFCRCSHGFSGNGLFCYNT